MVPPQAPNYPCPKTIPPRTWRIGVLQVTNYFSRKYILSCIAAVWHQTVRCADRAAVAVSFYRRLVIFLWARPDFRFRVSVFSQHGSGLRTTQDKRSTPSEHAALPVDLWTRGTNVHGWTAAFKRKLKHKGLRKLWGICLRCKERWYKTAITLCSLCKIVQR